MASAFLAQHLGMDGSRAQLLLEGLVLQVVLRRLGLCWPVGESL